MILTLVRFGTNSAGEVVFATPHQEIWWTDELLEPGESADVYYTVAVGQVPGDGRPFAHDWCNEAGRWLMRVRWGERRIDAGWQATRCLVLVGSCGNHARSKKPGGALSGQ